MDLSCFENKVNQRFPFYLMPGQEVNETPLGDMSQDLKSHAPRRSMPRDHRRSAGSCAL